MIKKLVIALYLSIASPMVMIHLLPTTAVAQEAPLWIDVRTPVEWNAGHLPNAILIPYDQISRKIGQYTQNKRQPINLYCRSGRRAEIALKTLEQMGFINVQNRGSYELLRDQ